MKGYNLPDNVSPSDPEAPWNKEEGKDITSRQEWLDVVESMQSLLSELKEAIEQGRSINEVALDNAYRELSEATPWEV